MTRRPKTWDHCPLRMFAVAWLLLACNFGVLLFFSSNSNIMNPNISIWPSVVKDASWIIGLSLVIRFYGGKSPPQLQILSMLTSVFLVGLLFAFVVKYEGLVNNINSIKSIKNAVLYTWAPICLASLVELNYEKFIRALMAVLSATLLVSVLIYLLVEADYKPAPPDLRMFGSTGNPNTTALFSTLLIILVTGNWGEMQPLLRRSYVVFALLGLYLSASYLYLLMSLLVLFYFTLISLQQKKYREVARFFVEMLLLSGVTWLIACCLVELFGYPGIPLELRFKSAVLAQQSDSLLMSDSVQIRLHALSLFSLDNVLFGSSGFRQYDSAFLTFAQNFGITGLMFMIFPYGFALFVLRQHRWDWGLTNFPLHICLSSIGLFFVSGLVHFQVSHFPSNFVMSLLFSFSLKELLMRANRPRKVQHAS